MPDVFAGEMDHLSLSARGRYDIETRFIPWLRRQIQALNTTTVSVPTRSLFYQKTVETILANLAINYIEHIADPELDADYQYVRIQTEMRFYVGARWRDRDGNENTLGVGRLISRGTLQPESTLRYDEHLLPTGSPWPEG